MNTALTSASYAPVGTTGLTALPASASYYAPTEALLASGNTAATAYPPAYAPVGAMQTPLQASTAVSQPGVASGNALSQSSVFQETPASQQAMLQTLYALLPKKSWPALQKLQQGVLLRNTGDTPYSTLYYLHQIATQPRAEGLSAVKTLQESVNLLSNVYTQKQMFKWPGVGTSRKLLALQAAAGQSLTNLQAAPTKRKWWQITSAIGNTCVPASVLASLVQRQPNEVARWIAEATSPAQTLYEQATVQELGFGDEAQTEQKLQTLNLPYQKTAPGVYKLAFTVPKAGLIRAIDTQKAWLLWPWQASGVETLLQTTLAYNITGKTYDASTDQRDAALVLFPNALQSTTTLTPEQKALLINSFNSTNRMDVFRTQALQALNAMPNVSVADRKRLVEVLQGEMGGLTDAETLLLKNVLEDGERFETVNFQVSGTPAGTHASYFYGYTKPLEVLTQDLLTMLQQAGSLTVQVSGLPATPGTDGKEKFAHQITLTGAEQVNGEWQFLLANSGPKTWGSEVPQRMSAKKLVPLVKTTVVPQAMAANFNTSMAPWQGQVVRPTLADKQAGYHLLHFNKGEPPQGTPYQWFLAQQQA
jgi:hypothetical protein